MKLSLFLAASVACGQIFMAPSGKVDENTCVGYDIEGSTLKMCNFVLRQEKLHPDARFPEVRLSGLVVNASDHEWARVRLKLVIKGTEETTGKPYRHECVHQYDGIVKSVPKETNCWLPRDSTRPHSLVDLGYEIDIEDDYTFPKIEELIAASKRMEEEAARERRLRDRQRQLNAVKAQATSEASKKCSVIYHATSTKRVVDLTVNDADAIQACKSLGLYRPGPVSASKPALKVQ